MSLTSAKQVETNKYELEIAVDGDTFNAAVDQAFRKNGKKCRCLAIGRERLPVLS